jgi:hypothetical protein
MNYNVTDYLLEDGSGVKVYLWKLIPEEHAFMLYTLQFVLKVGQLEIALKLIDSYLRIPYYHVDIDWLGAEKGANW